MSERYTNNLLWLIIPPALGAFSLAILLIWLSGSTAEGASLIFVPCFILCLLAWWAWIGDKIRKEKGEK